MMSRLLRRVSVFRRENPLDLRPFIPPNREDDLRQLCKTIDVPLSWALLELELGGNSENNENAETAENGENLDADDVDLSECAPEFRALAALLDCFLDGEHVGALTDLFQTLAPSILPAVRRGAQDVKLTLPHFLQSYIMRAKIEGTTGADPVLSENFALLSRFDTCIDRMGETLSTGKNDGATLRSLFGEAQRFLLSTTTFACSTGLKRAAVQFDQRLRGGILLDGQDEKNVEPRRRRQLRAVLDWASIVVAVEKLDEHGKSLASSSSSSYTPVFKTPRVHTPREKTTRHDEDETPKTTKTQDVDEKPVQPTGFLEFLNNTTPTPRAEKRQVVDELPRSLETEEAADENSRLSDAASSIKSMMEGRKSQRKLQMGSVAAKKTKIDRNPKKARQSCAALPKITSFFAPRNPPPNTL